MIEHHLPSVLVPNPPNTAISMERALRQIKELLENHTIASDDHVNDMINASIDDLDVMIAHIQR